MGQLTLFQEQMNDFIAQGGGEELMAMRPEELRRAINAYLDKGPDFLKFGGTSHFSEPTFIGFSAEAQQVIVEEAHKRGRAAETHATSIEGLRVSIAAGIDGIQHPELLDGREMPDDLVTAIRDRGLYCSMLASTITGPAWKRHLKTKDEVEKKRAEAEKEGRSPAREKTTAEQRKEAAEVGDGSRDAAEERTEADSRRLPRDAGHRQLLGRGARTDAHAEVSGAGPRHRHDHRHRRARRARHDARRRRSSPRRATARSPRAASTSSARSKPASAPTC